MANDSVIYSNNVAPVKAAKLSIITPFLDDDPSGWINALSSSEYAQECEIILIDDGTNNKDLTNHLRERIKTWPSTAKLVCFANNQGRSIARNIGISHATGEYVLFVDADMLPALPNFLEKYFDIINRKSAAIAFGGFITKEAETDHDTILHHNLSQSGDCRPLALRKTLGAYAIASNNLLVRRKTFEICKFDDRFSGWGWEDTEWALRAVSNGFGLVHIENPAIHIGIDTTSTMLNKYEEAGPNLALALAKHPIMSRFPAVKIARLVAKIPFYRILRPLARVITLDKKEIFPVFMRRMAIKFWRASWAAEALEENGLMRVGVR